MAAADDGGVADLLNRKVLVRTQVAEGLELAGLWLGDDVLTDDPTPTNWNVGRLERLRVDTAGTSRGGASGRSAGAPRCPSRSPTPVPSSAATAPLTPLLAGMPTLYTQLVRIIM